MSSQNTNLELIIALLWGLGFGSAIWAMGSLWLENRKLRQTNNSMTEPPPAMFRLLSPLAAPVSKLFDDFLQRAQKLDKKSSLLTLANTLNKNIVSAGVGESLKPADMIGSSFASSILGACGGYYIAFMQSYPASSLVLVGWIMGVVLPFIWLNDRLKKRQIEIRKALPYFLDLLTLCVESGLDFSTALVRILSKLDTTPLRYELDMVVSEITMGKSRSEALRDMAERINLVEISTVVSAIIQSDEMGSSLGSVLRTQANEARRRRLGRAEELALKAPVKIVFPLVAFIFPTTFIIVFGPIALKYILPLFK